MDCFDLLSLRQAIGSFVVSALCSRYSLSNGEISRMEGRHVTPEGSRKALNLMSRLNIRNEWNAKVESVRQGVGDMVGIDNIQFMPNFAQIAEEIRKPDSFRSELELETELATIGQTALLYFKGLEDFLRKEGFSGDEMLQEAFREAVTAKTVGLRVVEKLESSKKWNEAVIHDGVLWLQCEPREWRTNPHQVAEGLMKLL